MRNTLHNSRISASMTKSISFMDWSCPSSFDYGSHIVTEPTFLNVKIMETETLIAINLTLETDEWSVFPSYLSSKRRKLTYEKAPGVESGQTKLVFKYDFSFAQAQKGDGEETGRKKT